MITSKLPPGWAWATVGELLAERPSNGLSVKGADQPPGVRALKLNAMRDCGFDYSAVRYLPVESADVEGLQVKADDFFVSRGNGSLHLLGRGTLAGTPPFAVIFPDTMIRFRFAAPIVQTRWVPTIWSSPEVRGQLERKAKTTAGIWKLSQEDVTSVRIGVPPLNEQRSVVAAVEQHLSDVDAGVASLERVLAKVKRYRAAVLKAACEGRLVPTEAELAKKEGREYEPGDVLLRRILHERRARWEADQLAKMSAKGQVPRDERWKAKYEEPPAPSRSELPELPEGWTRTRLGQITSLVTSGSRGWGDRYSDVGPLFIRAQDIKTDCLVRENIARVDLTGSEEGTRTRIKRGDLLVTITGANVTKTASVVVELGEAYVSQHVGLVRPALVESAAFLHAWIVSPAHGRRRLERVAYGAGKPGLNLDNLRELPVAFPPLSEQGRILAEVDRLLSVADEVEQSVRAQLARGRRLRQSILKHAFEGKLVPQNPNDEPASVLLERIRSTQNTAERKQPRRQPPRRRASETEVEP
ncbi:restriction endonuclease subunit S [Sorangium sp. So ce362]|uniref:restriction endonuclease subunit S n=1 Tax=Sorangium sp. So ce362 TaxID=3133303 RepID=UPI003F635481